MTLLVVNYLLQKEHIFMRDYCCKLFESGDFFLHTCTSVAIKIILLNCRFKEGQNDIHDKRNVIQ